jgi:hypothetical protein
VNRFEEESKLGHGKSLTLVGLGLSEEDPLRDGAGPSHQNLGTYRKSKTRRQAPLSLQIEVAVSVVSERRQHGVGRERRRGTEPDQLTAGVISELPIGGSQGCSLLERAERVAPLAGVIGYECDDLFGSGRRKGLNRRHVVIKHLRSVESAAGQSIRVRPATR